MAQKSKMTKAEKEERARRRKLHQKIREFRSDDRRRLISYGIRYFYDEDRADAFAELVRDAGHYNRSGYLQGMPCGRRKDEDIVRRETGRKLYAVTTA